MLINKRTLSEAGLLADFMANVVEASFEEKLSVLSLFDVKERMVKVIELLQRQCDSIKSNVKITGFANSTIPVIIDIDDKNQGPTSIPTQIKPLAPMRRTSNNLPFSAPRGLGGQTGGGDDDDNEIEELQKRLEAANLSPEAAKVAGKELKRLKKMVPAQAEYAVMRSYLETLAEIPWTTLTEDRLGPGTLKAARKQLDDDHYGLDKVKQRLLEYLAVLRLKQLVNKDIDAKIKQAEEEAAAVESSKESKDGTRPSNLGEEAKASSAKIEVLKSKRRLDKSPILLLVGPPGVGKTSLARSVATALGRKFHRISLGGGK